MDPYLSRSEKKRLAKGVEKLSEELALLSDASIGKLPCDDFLKAEIKTVKGLKAGSRKRQIKFITKCLRELETTAPLMDFLEVHKGSKLKQDKSFHELERFRDDIITEAIESMRQADHFGETLDSRSWKCAVLDTAVERFPGLDATAIKLAALKYSRSRKPVFSREIFRILKGAMEQQSYAITKEGPAISD
jgi:ribosome-associated protein